MHLYTGVRQQSGNRARNQRNRHSNTKGGVIVAYPEGNKHYAEEAKQLIGQRAWLTGGGMPRNEMGLVLVKAVTDDCHVVLDAGDLISGVAEFSPLLASWRVREIHPAILPQLKAVANGHYRFSLDNRTMFKANGKAIKHLSGV
jgi:hypothetical protein